MPLPPPLTIDPATARRFALRATGLIQPHASLASALEHQGFIQIDPINVCGRMHEHIARVRVSGYEEGHLHQHLHGVPDDAPLDTTTRPAAERTAFEHFHPGRWVLAAFGVEAWPYLHAVMAQRARTPGQWMGQLTAPERTLARRILAEIGARGALASEHIDHDERSHNGWNTSRTVKVVMDKLFGQGRLLIARRQNGRRVYDLPERVLPAPVLSQRKPTAKAIDRWTAHLKLRQHRLVTLKRTELPLVSDLVQPVSVAGCPSLYCLRSDIPLLETAAEPPVEPRLLAPLDPLILDRTIAQKLWGFDYTWEVYTPAAKRKRGYYALPLLAGDRLIGDIDLKADRVAGRLRVVSRRCARGHRTAPAVRAVATFLGLK
ncbi:DNA glycosylase AlkZ-like family protein [Synoicihabitans lomoniglobus]|uniref:Crosslink repair DNA glycosylase YcaQ family protein n=1 Tax=Synoicihabitans lomoniglobus TaxID=2909285 RepID=A0AAF0CP90_9BACT|nr:winged helix DNA-binding domain-containing protein [Opitutaceae bacterium LMO-M01]WED63604.1 crosslink repair DNA glycosylase YcaQ family protein [Opitutaceae bacterium LMO-M01]